jgi:GNAT superfamily N-acetyltransferase
MTDPHPGLMRMCVATIRDDGVGAFCVKAARRIRESLVVTNHADWYRADLSRRPARAPAPPRASLLADAPDEVLAWIKSIRGVFRFTYIEAEWAAARRHGHVFPLLRVDGANAGYIKVGLRRAYVSDFAAEIAVPDECAFIYDTFVHPDFRGRGLATYMVAAAMDHLAARGVRRVWCHIPRWNVASQRCYAANGFARAAHMRYVRLAGAAFYTRNPARLMRSQPGEGLES